jgi:hypothetical protein
MKTSWMKNILLATLLLGGQAVQAQIAVINYQDENRASEFKNLSNVSRFRIGHAPEDAEGTGALYVMFDEDGVENKYMMPKSDIKSVKFYNREDVESLLIPARLSEADTLHFFTELLCLTGWDKRLTNLHDVTYESEEMAGCTYMSRFGGSFTGKYPARRDVKYTIFAETDEVFIRQGIIDIATLKEYLKKNAYYDEATSYGDDYTSEDNAVNQFVAYHILKVGLDWNTMVTWSNEYGYSNQNPNGGKNREETPVWKCNVWEYWETLGKHRRTLKITGIDGPQYRLNRCSHYDVSSAGYRELTAEEDPLHIDGIVVYPTKAAISNGKVFTIGDVLLWTEAVPTRVLNERMRYDFCSLLPEMVSNNCRLNRENNWYFPNGYFENLSWNENTEFLYLPNTGCSGDKSAWVDFQTDEFCVMGQFDMMLKLPPVPFTGTYAIRLATFASSRRPVVQMYLGEDKDNLRAWGIPLDSRGLDNTTTYWIPDTGDQEIDKTHDKLMDNLGWMKAPKYFQPACGVSPRDIEKSLRCIIATLEMEAGKTYYLRMKSVLQSLQTEMYYDYLEIVPKSIYAGEVSEDQW